MPIALGPLPTACHRPPTPTPLHPPNPLRCPLRASEGESARLEQSTPSRALVQSSRAITNSQLISSSPSVNGTKAFSNMQPTGAVLLARKCTQPVLGTVLKDLCAYSVLMLHSARMFFFVRNAWLNATRRRMACPVPHRKPSPAVACCIDARAPQATAAIGLRPKAQKQPILSRARVHHCGTPPAVHGRRRAEASAGGGDPARDARKALDLAPCDTCA